MEQNKIIAEFMGWKILQEPLGQQYLDIIRIHTYSPNGKIISSTPIGDSYSIKKSWEDLINPDYGRAGRYHKSWDALMSVVEKIEQMDYGFKICRKVVEIYIDSNKETLFHIKEKSKLESLYTAVIQFIQWYNIQNIK